MTTRKGLQLLVDSPWGSSIQTPRCLSKVGWCAVAQVPQGIVEKVYKSVDVLLSRLPVPGALAFYTECKSISLRARERLVAYKGQEVHFRFCLKVSVVLSIFKLELHHTELNSLQLLQSSTSTYCFPMPRYKYGCE